MLGVKRRRNRNGILDENTNLLATQNGQRPGERLLRGVELPIAICIPINHRTPTRQCRSGNLRESERELAGGFGGKGVGVQDERPWQACLLTVVQKAVL